MDKKIEKRVRSPEKKKKQLTFYVVSDKNLFQAPAELSEYDKYQSLRITMIAVMDGDELTFFSPLRDSESQDLDAFADVMDSADLICTFNEKHQYSLLSPCFPKHHQRLVYWRFKTLDFFNIVKKETKVWPALRDLCALNLVAEIKNKYALDGTAAAREFANSNIDGIKRACENHVRIVHELYKAISKAPKMAIRYAILNRKKTGPFAKGEITSTDSVSAEKSITERGAEWAWSQSHAALATAPEILPENKPTEVPGAAGGPAGESHS